MAMAGLRDNENDLILYSKRIHVSIHEYGMGEYEDGDKSRDDFWITVGRCKRRKQTVHTGEEKVTINLNK